MQLRWAQVPTWCGCGCPGLAGSGFVMDEEAAAGRKDGLLVKIVGAKEVLVRGDVWKSCWRTEKI